jgi:hypothetical protein
MQEKLNVRKSDLTEGKPAMRKFLILACTASPAWAEDVFARPDQCIREATVQYDNCEVENLFVCKSEAGQVRRTESTDETGTYAVDISPTGSRNTAIHFVGTTGSTRLTMEGGTLLDAIQTGTATESAKGEIQLFGMWRPTTGMVVYDHKGESEEHAGKIFKRIVAESTVQLPYPAPPIAGTQVILYLPELNLTVTSETSFKDSPIPIESSKMVELALPGQPGFGVEFPMHGCMETSATTFFAKEVQT